MSYRALLLLLFLFFVGCGVETAVLTTTPIKQPTAAMTPTATEKPLRYLALGDSYTIGASVAVTERWPVQLVAALRAQGVNLSDPEIIAKTGWTTAELAEGIAEAQPQGPYDLVSLLIGVNNQYRGLSEKQYREQFVGLLETAVSLAGNQPNRVFVISIPDWGVMPFAQSRNREEISANIDAFNRINREETEQRSVIYIDITFISRQALTESSLVAEDTLHPSGEMYRLWANKMLPILIEKSLNFYTKLGR